jgi:hypothetical protein
MKDDKSQSPKARCKPTWREREVLQVVERRPPQYGDEDIVYVNCVRRRVVLGRATTVLKEDQRRLKEWVTKPLGTDEVAWGP